MWSVPGPRPASDGSGGASVPTRAQGAACELSRCPVAAGSRRPCRASRGIAGDEMGVTMAELRIRCDCGWTFCGPDPEGVAAAVAHAFDAHRIALTRQPVPAVA